MIKHARFFTSSLNFDDFSQSSAHVFSVRPPDGLVYACGRTHCCGRVAVAAVSIHAVALVAQAGIEQAVVSARGASGSAHRGTGRQHAGGRPVASRSGAAWRNHGELVGAGSGAVVQVVRRGVGLEVGVLVLVARVWRRQVGVIAAGGGHPGHAETTDSSAGRVSRVGEGTRIMHV